MAIACKTEDILVAMSFDFKGTTKIVGILSKTHKTERLSFTEIYQRIERFNTEHETSLKLVSNEVIDYLLNSDLYIGINFSSFLVDLVIAYEAPDKPFDSKVIYDYDGYQRMVFSVPKKYQGKKNIALAVAGLTNTDFKMVTKGIRIHDPEYEGKEIAGLHHSRYIDKEIIVKVPEKRIIAIPEFRYSNILDYQLPHAKTKIPHGPRVKQSSKARCIMSLPGPYVGHVTRYYSIENDDVNQGDSMDANASSLDNYVRVVVEMSEKDAKKLNLL
ncbi:hypothetical protein HY570_00370 [Candidatus Micrarchaeota archaeon]|nr:hypothetical protein [Candidatus Micrarchaeota archaeon]